MCLLIYLEIESMNKNKNKCGDDLIYVEEDFKGNLTIPQYADTLCKIRNGVELS